MGFREAFENAGLLSPKQTVVVDRQAAGEFSGKLCQAEREFARGDSRKTEPPPKPSCGDALQDEINEVEIALNRVRQKADGISQEMAPYRLAISSGATQVQRIFLDAKIRDLTPVFEKAQSEVADLQAKHKDLLAKRKDRDRELARSAHCCV